MSADNWAVCPKCLEAKCKGQAALFKAADLAYGKVPKEEYQRLRKKALGFAVPVCDTFREDYEIGIDGEGRLHISYSGGCTECEFTKEFSYNEQQ